MASAPVFKVISEVPRHVDPNVLQTQIVHKSKHALTKNVEILVWELVELMRSVQWLITILSVVVLDNIPAIHLSDVK